MPIYDYACSACGRFEAEHPISAPPLAACPTCGRAVTKLVSRNVGIVFKGPGFYITDSRKQAGAGEDTKAADKPEGKLASPTKTDTPGASAAK
ncbi:MAG: FmdB family zinc ribbon protein [Bacillota bacterium]